jgi:hypothetical protein
LGGDPVHDLADAVEKKIVDMIEKDEVKNFELLSAVDSEAEARNEEEVLKLKKKVIDMAGERFELVHRAKKRELDS